MTHEKEESLGLELSKLVDSYCKPLNLAYVVSVRVPLQDREEGDALFHVATNVATPYAQALIAMAAMKMQDEPSGYVRKQED